jgi:Lrp/AsnC family leucine-responsive transcriptional regulator
MAMTEKLDQIDKKILKILSTNSGISNIELASQIGLSATPTFERVKKLEKQKVIRGYHADINPQPLGLGIETFMMVSLAKTDRDSTALFLKQINEIDEVLECYRILGSSSDYMMKIIVKDMPAYEYLAMETIRNIKEVSQLKTMVILSTLKKNYSLPL